MHITLSLFLELVPVQYADWPRDYILEPNAPEGAGNWGFMNPPGGAVDDGGSGFSIPKQCAHIKEAWDVLSW